MLCYKKNPAGERKSDRKEAEMIYRLHRPNGIPYSRWRIEEFAERITMEIQKGGSVMLLPRDEPYPLTSGFDPGTGEFCLHEIVPLMEGGGFFSIITIPFSGKRSSRGCPLYLPGEGATRKRRIVLPDDRHFVTVAVATDDPDNLLVVEFIYYHPEIPVAHSGFTFSLN